MSSTDRFETFRAMLLEFVRDPVNGYCPQGREVDAVETTRIPEFWDVVIIYKDKEGDEPRKVGWLRAAGQDKATRRIYVEEVVAWMWRKTERQIKALVDAKAG